MQTVRFVEGTTRWPYARQTPANDGVFGRTQFVFGPGPESTDWLVVLNEIPDGVELASPRERALFISGEPPSVRKFLPDFLAQFGTAFSVDPDLPHPNVQVMSSLVPWHVGVRSNEPATYADAMVFSELEKVPQKTKLCSCITSTANYTPGHRRRVEFVRRLKRQLGDRIDFFGRGILPIPDKDVGLAPYRFTIAVENSAVPGYWTEKLADPFLRNCFPIYAGAPNVNEYFDPGSMQLIDMRDPDRAIEIIKRVLASEVDLSSAAIVAESKRRVLWSYNILAWIDRYTESEDARSRSHGPAHAIRAEKTFRLPETRYSRVATHVVGSVREAGRAVRRALRSR